MPALISVTGSTRAGMEVSKAAAADLKRVHLELGGKAPVVVFGDVDLDDAAVKIAEAGLTNAGQDCAAGCRVLVHESVHDQFVERLVDAVKATTYGPPHEDVAIGPVNSLAAWNE